VDSLEEAIAHINQYGSGHTDTIVSSDPNHVEQFMNFVDSAGVYHNCSTRFSDGFLYGLGAEVGIATGKLHARGPMGMEGLCSYKYRLFGNGHTVADLNEGKIALTHKEIEVRPEG
jgi:glutamate-5-semialdehyde dehydrogenase